MVVKVNVYYDTNVRSLNVCYNMFGPQTVQGEPLLRVVDVNKAREFIEFVYASFVEFKNTRFFPVPINNLRELYDDKFNFPLRVLRVKVPEPHDVVIIERNVGDWIPAGSRFFCGKCGESICRSTEAIMMPFGDLTWKTKATDYAYTLSVLGLQCGHCKNYLFTNAPYWFLTDIEGYFEGMDKIMKSKTNW